jgi:hypothetical protein
MRPFLIVVAVIGTELCLIPRPVAAQSLAEVAAREKARRTGKVDRVITEEDLQRARREAPPEEAAPATETASATEGTTTKKDTGASAGKHEKTEEEQREDRRKDWQARADKAQQDVTRLTQEVDDLQQRAGDMRLYQLGPNHAKMLERLETAKQELAAAQARVEALEDERRQQGY